MSRLGKHLAISGSVMQLGLIVSFVVAVVQMGRAMNLLDPLLATQSSDVAAAVQVSFRATAIGLSVSLIGLLLTLVSVSACKYRASWIRSVMWSVAVFRLFSTPPLGLVLMACLTVAGRRAFQPQESPQGSPAASI